MVEENVIKLRRAQLMIAKEIKGINWRFIDVYTRNERID